MSIHGSIGATLLFFRHDCRAVCKNKQLSCKCVCILYEKISIWGISGMIPLKYSKYRHIQFSPRTSPLTSSCFELSELY